MKISMLFTTYNRATQLSRTLDRLSRLTKPDELVIVDDGSTDDTRTVIKNAKEKLVFLTKVVFGTRKF